MAVNEELGWLARLLTVLVKAMSGTFDADYPVADFAGTINIGTEFPRKETDYPGIWVDFEPTGELQTAGIGHVEYVVDADNPLLRHKVKRWTFQGYATFTIVTLSSFERARLLDEVVKVMSFGDLDVARSQFRDLIQQNDYLGMQFDFDQVGVSGKSEMQGTPWGTDDVVYEMTVRMECVGEFVSDVQTQGLAVLSEVLLYPYSTAEPDPGEAPPLSDDPSVWR
jgi:hypothetical protein